MNVAPQCELESILGQVDQYLLQADLVAVEFVGQVSYLVRRTWWRHKLREQQF